MNKLIVFLLLGLLAVHYVSAVNVGLRLRSRLGLGEESEGSDEGGEESGEAEESGESEGGSEGSTEGAEESSSDTESSSEGGGKAISATRLQNQESTESSEDSCDQKPKCQQQPVFNNEEDNKPQKVSPEELVKPIDEWIKDFKKRATGGSGDLYNAAKATVKPLIDKLRRSQELAQEKLKESNENILAHVQDATTEHVYKLLRASKKADDKDEKKEEAKEKVAEKKDEQSEKEEESKLAEESANEASANAKGQQEASENAAAIKQVADKAAQKSS